MKSSNIDYPTSPSVDLVRTESESIMFPKGVIGFQEYTHYTMSHYGDEIYSVLSCDEDRDIRFLICKLPWDFYPTKDLVEGLILENLDEIDEEIYAIVCCSEEVPTMNLRAPLVKRDEQMWQIVLHDNYPLDYRLE